MSYLIRPKAPPRLESLSESDRKILEGHFDAHPAELTVEGQVIQWKVIEEVEVVKAARQRTLAGWFVRNVIYGSERYHVGIYFGPEEAVLPNITLSAAEFIVQSIAYYMQKPIQYTGLEGFVPVSEEP